MRPAGSARRARLVASNAAVDVPLPIARQANVDHWLPEELGTILDHAGCQRLGALYESLTFDGLRRGKACW